MGRTELSNLPWLLETTISWEDVALEVELLLLAILYLVINEF